SDVFGGLVHRLTAQAQETEAVDALGVHVGLVEPAGDVLAVGVVDVEERVVAPAAAPQVRIGPGQQLQGQRILVRLPDAQAQGGREVVVAATPAAVAVARPEEALHREGAFRVRLGRFSLPHTRYDFLGGGGSFTLDAGDRSLGRGPRRP